MSTKEAHQISKKTLDKVVEIARAQANYSSSGRQNQSQKAATKTKKKEVPVPPEDLKECFVCGDEVEVMCLFPCDHTDVCAECVTRVRVLSKDKECLYCKTSHENLVAMSIAEFRKRGNPTVSYAQFEFFGDLAGAEFRLDEGSGIFFHASAEKERARLVAMRRLVCGCTTTYASATGDSKGPGKGKKGDKKAPPTPVGPAETKTHPPCKHVDKSIDALAGHVKSTHGMHICLLCASHQSVFPQELPRFTDEELQRHNEGTAKQTSSTGKPDPTAVEYGHPLCLLCDTRFYDEQLLYQHLRQEHYHCHLCLQRQRGDREYYNMYEDLDAHFRAYHIMCDDPACADEKFVAFNSQLELIAHKIEHHNLNSKYANSVLFTGAVDSAETTMGSRPRMTYDPLGRKVNGKPRVSSMMLYASDYPTLQLSGAQANEALVSDRAVSEALENDPLYQSTLQMIDKIATTKSPTYDSSTQVTGQSKGTATQGPRVPQLVAMSYASVSSAGAASLGSQTAYTRGAGYDRAALPSVNDLFANAQRRSVASNVPEVNPLSSRGGNWRFNARGERVFVNSLDDILARTGVNVGAADTPTSRTAKEELDSDEEFLLGQAGRSKKNKKKQEKSKAQEVVLVNGRPIMMIKSNKDKAKPAVEPSMTEMSPVLDTPTPTGLTPLPVPTSIKMEKRNISSAWHRIQKAGESKPSDSVLSSTAGGADMAASLPNVEMPKITPTSSRDAVNAITDSLGESRFRSFLELSAQYRQGGVDAHSYHAQVREIFCAAHLEAAGKSDSDTSAGQVFLDSFPVLMALLPDVDRRKQVLEVHQLWLFNEGSDWQEMIDSSKSSKASKLASAPGLPVGAFFKEEQQPVPAPIHTKAKVTANSGAEQTPKMPSLLTPASTTSSPRTPSLLTPANSNSSNSKGHKSTLHVAKSPSSEEERPVPAPSSTSTSSRVLAPVEDIEIEFGGLLSGKKLKGNKVAKQGTKETSTTSGSSGSAWQTSAPKIVPESNKPSPLIPSLLRTSTTTLSSSATQNSSEEDKHDSAGKNFPGWNVAGKKPSLTSAGSVYVPLVAPSALSSLTMSQAKKTKAVQGAAWSKASDILNSVQAESASNQQSKKNKKKGLKNECSINDL